MRRAKQVHILTSTTGYVGGSDAREFRPSLGGTTLWGGCVPVWGCSISNIRYAWKKLTFLSLIVGGLPSTEVFDRVALFYRVGTQVVKKTVSPKDHPLIMVCHPLRWVLISSVLVVD